MKKILGLFIIPLISLFFVTEVKAEEKYMEFQEDFSLIQEQIFSIGQDVLDSGINSIINYYKENNYSVDNPYYYISVSLGGDDCLYIFLSSFSKSNFDDHLSQFNQATSSSYNIFTPIRQIIFKYDSSLNSFSFESSNDSSSGGISLFRFFEFYGSNFIYPYNYYYSNFDYYYYGTSLSEFQSTASLPLNYLSVDDKLYVPLYDNPTTYSVYNSTEDFLIEPYYLYDKESTLEPDSDIYTVVDLNNYSYIALSLKDYEVEAFDSTFYVKGQLCPTVVYNYGLEERTNTDRCNIPYDDFTPIRYRISDNDINNHFIYYFKAYDTSIENKVKVDSSIFNIHYITEEEKDNPILDINGHKYSSIPYDDLSSTANKNEEENFVPGEVERVPIESFFDKPLELLKSVWGAIQAIFMIITEFILLLPPVMQGFLFTAFGISIVLGIIKILL